MAEHEAAPDDIAFTEDELAEIHARADELRRRAVASAERVVGSSDQELYEASKAVTGRFPWLPGASDPYGPAALAADWHAARAEAEDVEAAYDQAGEDEWPRHVTPEYVARLEAVVAAARVYRGPHPIGPGSSSAMLEKGHRLDDALAALAQPPAEANAEADETIVKDDT